MPGGRVRDARRQHDRQPAGRGPSPGGYESETELYADLDLSQLEKGNLDFDPCGHYSRPDVFQLKVNTAPLRAVNFSDE
ncbi:hypothetical protein [Pseudomonas aeruginosa]|uniref:hypothetical protein n=1 Tax=Pseudomonas aeruginosa TaxID=287 RepID=UPI00211180E1|nr:hypothetical protein [Pseudomonas aeruginosa]MCT9633884.1 hypothetical protein [Pseudomonas aeruginosa]